MRAAMPVAVTRTREPLLLHLPDIHVRVRALFAAPALLAALGLLARLLSNHVAANHVVELGVRHHLLVTSLLADLAADEPDERMCAVHKVERVGDEEHGLAAQRAADALLEERRADVRVHGRQRVCTRHVRSLPGARRQCMQDAHTACTKVAYKDCRRCTKHAYKT
jgi:hypothetical protein